MPSEKSLANLKPWKPGQSGNPAGRPPTMSWRERLVEQLSENEEENLKRAVKVLIQLALAGDVSALNHIADRLDGKPKQQTAITGAGDGPVQVVIRVE